MYAWGSKSGAYAFCASMDVLHIRMHPLSIAYVEQGFMSHLQIKACRALAVPCEDILEAADPGEQPLGRLIDEDGLPAQEEVGIQHEQNVQV